MSQIVDLNDLPKTWLKLVSEKIRREQIGAVPTFFNLRKQIRQVENRFKCDIV